jgi:hypothetical protein
MARPNTDGETDDTSGRPIKFEFVSLTEDGKLALESAEPLRQRMGEWLERAKGARRGRMSLDVEDVRVVHSALSVASGFPRAAPRLDSLEEQLLKGIARYRKTRNPRELVRALGLSNGTRGAEYPSERVVSDYLWLIGVRPDHTLPWIRLLSPRSEPYPHAAVSGPEAIRILSRAWGFPKETACRLWLVRARRALQMEFAIPSATRLDKIK